MLFRSEELDDFGLNFFDLIERDVGVFYDEDFASFPVLIDAEDAAGGGLGIGLAEEFLALEHDSEDVAGVLGVVLVFFYEGLQEGLCALLGDRWCGAGGQGWGENGAPVGEGFSVILIGGAGIPGGF